MTQIAQGAHVYLFPEPGQVFRVQADDVATVQILYGAPSAVITLTAQSQTFGPYDSPAKLKVTANTAPAEYTLLRAHYVELTQAQIDGGAVGALASDDAGGVIEPDGDVPTLGGSVTLPAMQTAFDTGTAPEKAAFQTAVSGAQFISAASYGLSSSASAEVNTAALVSFRNAVAAATTINQGVVAIIPPGRYNVSPMLTAGEDPYAGLPNWAIKGMTLDTTGATFISAGNAPVFWGDGGRIDAGLPAASRAVLPTSNAGVYKAFFKGLRVAAPSVGAAGKALSFTKMHHGGINAEVIQTNGIGLDIGFVVAARIEYAISVNRGDFGGLVPSKGMLIRQDAIAGDWGTASYLDIVAPIIEGVNVGVDMTGGLGCSFWGGAIEGNTGKAVITSGPSHHNRFIGVDFEANPAGDFLIGSNYIDILACDSLHDITINGNFCNIDGGRHNNIHLGATSNNCRIACAYNAVDGLGVLQDLGQKNTLAQARDAANGWVGRKYNRYNSAPVGAQHLITNTSGDQWMLSYSGGAGVKCYTSLGGSAAVAPGVAPNGEMPLPPNTSMFLLPGQTVVLANWTTAPTDIVVWR